MPACLRLPSILMFALIFAPPASAQYPINKADTRENPKIARAFRGAIAQARESVVRVFGEGRPVAFGVVVDSDGWILTKGNDLLASKKITIKLKDVGEVEAKIVGLHDAYDLLMLKVEAQDLKAIQWSNAKEAKPGRWVASVGETEDPVAIGVVGVAARKLAPGDQPPRTTNINAGFLGVGLDAGEGGAKVVNLIRGAPAFSAGIKINDVIFEAAGQKILDQESLINVIQRHRPSDQVKIRLKRNDEEIEIVATLGRLPREMLGNPQEKMGGTLSNRRGGFPTILQHDTVLRPADCGSPLVDLDGKVVGLNIARAGRTETYAIPAEDIQPLLGDLKSGKLAPKVDLSKIELPAKNPNIVLRVAEKLTRKDPLDKVPHATRDVNETGQSFHRVYEVAFEKGVEYSIELNSGDFDAYLRLENAKGRNLAEDDDGGGDHNARIVFRARTDGAYRIIATSFKSGETGAFELIVRKN